MSNVGYATISVIPSLKGGGAALASEMSGPAGAAGTQAGGLFGGAFGGALGGVLAGGAAVAGIGAGLAAIGGSFDEAFDAIRVKTGATGTELEGLKDVFRSAVSDVPTDFGSAADAIGGLQQRLHLSGDDLTGLSEQVLELSRITETDLTGNVDGVTRAFGDWSVATGDQQATLDQFFRASQLSGTSVADLASSVTNFGSPLRQLGFGLTDSLSLFSRFESEGVNTSTVMSGMRQAVKNLGSGFAQEQTGVTDFQDVIAGVKDGTFDLQDAFAVFGARAAPDMFAAIQDGRFDLQAFNDQIANGTDTILGAADDTNDWRESLEQLKNRALVLIEPLATRVFNALGQGADVLLGLSNAISQGGLRGGMEFLGDIFARIPTPIKIAAAAMFALVSPLGAVAAGAVYAYTHFEGFRKVVDAVARWLVGTAWPAIQTFATGIAEAFGEAVAWVQERWPAIQEAIGHVLVVVRTIIAGFTAWAMTIWHAWGDDIVHFLQAAWSYVVSTIRNAINVVRGIIDTVLAVINGDWGDAWNGIKQILSAVWNQMKAVVRLAWAALKAVLGAGLSSLKTLWRAAWTAIKAVLSATWAAIRAVVRAGINALRGMVSAGLNGIRSLFVSIWNGIKGAVSSAWGAIKRTVHSGATAIVGFIRDIPGHIASFVGGMWDGLVDGFTDAINAIIGIWNDFRITFGGYDIPGPGPNIPSFTIDTPNIPYLAEGGTLTRAGSVLVGEKGPELLSLPMGARVSPLDRAVRAAGPALVRVEIDLTGAPEALVRELRKHVRVNGGDVQAVLGGKR